MGTEPHWEHGYRCHGLWMGLDRIGHVGLTPPGNWETEYSWSFDLPNDNSAFGIETNLRKAKSKVMKAYEEWQKNEERE